MTCSIGKVGGAGIGYYTESVAKDAHDYRTGAGESQGIWLGSLAERLGLSGEVTTEQVTAAFDARNPHTGESLIGNRSRAQRSVFAFDLTFSAPKSVSLMWALADDATRAKIIDAHEAAHADALGYYERNVLRTRTRAGGSEKLKAEGVLVASYRHRTSRVGDPQLHSHDVVFNFTLGEDDVWRAIDTAPMYAQSKTLGMIYHARLRAEITERLGLEFETPSEHGQAELKGFTREQLLGFSKRRTELAGIAREKLGGGITGKAYQVANLETRARKPEEGLGLYERWQREAAEAGVLHTVESIAGQQQPSSWVAQVPTQSELDALVIDPLEGVTAKSTVFARHDLVKFLATKLTAGAPSEVIEELADLMLEHSPGIVPLGEAQDTTLHTDDVIRLSSKKLVKVSTNTKRFTTEELLSTEVDALALARYRNETDQQCGKVAGHDVRALLASRPTIGDDQAEVLRKLLRGGEPITMVTGPPGTGKTYSLDAAHQAWKAAGYHVYGACLAAAAAENLQAETGISSTTVAQLIGKLADGYRIPAGSVLVLDEVGMIGTRELALLLEAAHEAHTKVVCIIDDRQLPSIQAGGLGRSLIAALGSVELSNNRRQKNPTERIAVAQLRAGEIKKAYESFEHAGGIHRHDNAENLRAQIIGHYLASRTDPMTVAQTDAIVADVAIYTSTWYEAQSISADVREQLQARGEIGPDRLRTISAITGDPIALAVGDEVLLKRNEYRRLNVRNSNIGKITSIDEKRRTITLLMGTGARKGEHVEIDTKYLEAGHVEHAYARVVKANQGATIKFGHFLATERTCTEEALVAMSRGQHANRMYLLKENEQDVLDAMERRSVEALAAEHLTEEVVTAADERLREVLIGETIRVDPAKIIERARQLRPKLDDERTLTSQQLEAVAAQRQVRSRQRAQEEHEQAHGYDGHGH